MPLLDNEDIIYDLTMFLCIKNSKSAALAMTVPIRGTSKEKLYQELFLESLQYRC